MGFEPKPFWDSTITPRRRKCREWQSFLCCQRARSTLGGAFKGSGVEVDEAALACQASSGLDTVSPQLPRPRVRLALQRALPGSSSGLPRGGS